MKKACFSLLAVVILLPMLCCSVHAAGSELQVYRPYEDDLIKVDGAISEIYWSAADSTSVGSSTLSFLCDGYGLYLAFETGAGTATFTINDVTFTCSLGDAPTINEGTIAGKSGVYELKLAYTALSLTPAKAKESLPYTATIAGSSVSGTLRLCSNGLASDLSFVTPRVLYSMRLAFLQNDDAPAATKSSAYSVNRLVPFDTNHNTLVLDQGKNNPHRFNRITLYDLDEVSRVSQNDLGVFISDSGTANSWKKVTGWQLHQSGTRYTIYNLDETARYIKVHCYLDNLNDPEDSTPFAAPSFTNYISDMITVEYSPYLLGADRDFARSAPLTVHNPGSAALYDQPVRFTPSQTGARSGEYRADCADFRFTLGDQLLPHWYDNETGSFYVRIPSIPAGGSTVISAHWGNPEADDVSDRQATFEAVYGNVSLIDLSKNTNLVGSGRSFTFPDGSIIAVARAKDTDDDGNVGPNELAAVFSYDGGRTFPKGVDLIPDDNHYANTAGFGSFIWDPTIGDKGRLILMAYMPKVAAKNGYEEADCRFVMLSTDDYGKTWSEPRVLSDAKAEPATDNDIVIKNSQDRFYQLSYCDGLTLKDADGDGPNVDYVLSHSYFRPDGTFSGCALFSKDGGKNWIASEGEITMETTIAHENGISETAFAQLDDGSLYIVARAQAANNLYFYESWSYDYGETWTTAKPSPVISTNTSPVMLPYGKDRLLMWAGNNSLSGTSRRRFPMTLAISSDNYQTYVRSIDLTLGTAFDTLEDGVERMTQPSLSLSPDGSEAFVCWTNLQQSSTVGMLIEEFGDMIYKTRGAYDGFECTAIKGEGWLLGERNASVYGTAGEVIISTDEARSGSHSMCVTDDSVDYPDNPDTPAVEPGGHKRVYVLRQIPSMRTGTVGISLYVPSGNTTDFVFELKPAYNYSYGKFTVAGFGITADGSLFRVVGGSATTDRRELLNKTVSLDEWHDYSIEFDMADTKKGTLFVDGDPVATFDLFGDYDRITVAELSEYQPTETTGSAIYVDDFYAVELAEEITVEPGESLLSVSEYKNKGTLPQQDGCVFAGWYADAARTIPHTLPTGYAYTKFVDQDVLRVKVQISANTARATQKTDLRLLTSVDNANYDRVGFKVTIGAKTQIISSSKVFRRIVANEGGIVCYHSPNVFSEQSRYFMTYTITNVPNAAFGAEIRVVPFWITLDGTEVTGEELSFTVNDVIDHGSSGLSSSSQGSGDSESFEDMFAPQT